MHVTEFHKGTPGLGKKREDYVGVFVYSKGREMGRGKRMPLFFKMVVVCRD